MAILGALEEACQNAARKMDIQWFIRASIT